MAGNGASMEHLQKALRELSQASRKRPLLDVRGSRLYDLYVMQARESLTELIDLSWDDDQDTTPASSSATSAGREGDELGALDKPTMPDDFTDDAHGSFPPTRSAQGEEGAPARSAPSSPASSSPGGGKRGPKTSQ